MALSQFLAKFMVLSICLFWTNRTDASANASFSHLPANVLKDVSSYLTATESAKVFRFINKQCDAGHRQQVIAKVDEFKSLLERFQDQSLEDAQVTAERSIDLFHDLKLSGLFALEGPRILQQWIDAMHIELNTNSNLSGDESLDSESSGLRDIYRSMIGNMIPHRNSPENVLSLSNQPDQGLVDLLVLNSHSTYRHLLISQSHNFHPNQRIHLVVLLLLNECLWERARDGTGLPPLEDLFTSMDCAGHHHDAVKNLVQTEGLILIHPSHHTPAWTPPVVDHLRCQMNDEIRTMAIDWMTKALRTFPDSDHKRGYDDVAILWMIKTIQSGGSVDPNLFDRTFYKLFEPRSELWVPKAFEVFMQSDIRLFSEALRKIAEHCGIKQSLEPSRYLSDDERCDLRASLQKLSWRRYFEIFGTAIDVVTVLKPERKNLDAKWGAVLSHIALNWINGNGGVSTELMRSEKWILECYDEGDGRMNRENLIKIQEAFPWMMPDDLIETLLSKKSNCPTTYSDDMLIQYFSG